MPFLSTRGEGCASFTDSALGGLAPDRGLWVPAHVPAFSPAAKATYAELAAAVVGAFAEPGFNPDPPLESFRAAALDAYAPERFGHPAIAPLSQLGPDLWLLELFHGPSLAFKDFALAMMGALWDDLLARRDARMTAIVATSGDTGGAAAAALAGRARIDLVILHPKGRISEVQRRFMTALGAPNIDNIAIEGDFDQCQALVKRALADHALVAEIGLASVNSINWLRIAAQAAYYFWAAQSLGRPYEAIVPTGNFGDAISALVAKFMGAPITRIVAATNENDILHRLFETGRLARAPSRATLAPAMDIQAPSNFERALYWALGGDGAGVRRLMTRFEAEGEVAIPESAMAWLKEHFTTARASDPEIAAAIARNARSSERVVCPHTGAGLVAAAKTAPDAAAGPRLVLATAHAAKFPEAADTTGLAAEDWPRPPARARAILTATERLSVLPAEPAALAAFLRARSGRSERQAQTTA